MTGPLEIVGADTAPVCEDGVCEIPGSRVGRRGLGRQTPSGLTASTGHVASRITRCATLPSSSLPTGVRGRTPTTIRLADDLGGDLEDRLGDVGYDVVADLALDVQPARARRCRASISSSCGVAGVDQAVAPGVR